MSYRSAFSATMLFVLTLILGTGLGVWYGKNHVDATVRTEITKAFEKEFASRQTKLDESIQQQTQPLLQKLEAAVQETQNLRKLSPSEPRNIDHPPVENVDALLRDLDHHFRFKQGPFVVNERTLISDDIGTGGMFVINYALDRNGVSNCTDLVVLSPKPYNTHPHNPPAVMSARYIDPANSEQIERVRYEVEFTGAKYQLFATIETFGINEPLTGGWSYVQMLAK